jgi:hypothetical protein
MYRWYSASEAAAEDESDRRTSMMALLILVLSILALVVGSYLNGRL